MKILLVDDSVINQKIILRKLKILDVDLDKADSGIEAIDLFQKNTPDIVLMDIHMPGMNGIETTQKIRDISKDVKRPLILAISNSDEEKDKIKYLENGMNGSLDKNFDIADLIIIAEEYSLKINVKNKSSIDLEPLRTFAEGDKDFIIDVLESFLKDAEKNWELVKQYQKDEQLEDLKFITHKIKSAFNFIGNPQLGSMAHKIEMAALNLDKKAFITDLISQMDHEFCNFMVDLNVELENLKKK